MSDQELVQSILTNILTAVAHIERRFNHIQQSDGFVLDDFGLDQLDSITRKQDPSPLSHLRPPHPLYIVSTKFKCVVSVKTPAMLPPISPSKA